MNCNGSHISYLSKVNTFLASTPSYLCNCIYNCPHCLLYHQFFLLHKSSRKQLFEHNSHFIYLSLALPSFLEKFHRMRLIYTVSNCSFSIPCEHTVVSFLSYYSCHQLLSKSQRTFTLPHPMVNSHPHFIWFTSIHWHRELFLKYLLLKLRRVVPWRCSNLTSHSSVSYAGASLFFQSQNFSVIHSQVCTHFLCDLIQSSGFWYRLSLMTSKCLFPVQASPLGSRFACPAISLPSPFMYVVAIIKLIKTPNLDYCLKMSASLLVSAYDTSVLPVAQTKSLEIFLITHPI